MELLKLNFKAIILAAGYGTRLGEMGQKLPKGLIPYRKTNLISHVATELNSLGIKDIAVVTNAKYIEQYRGWQASLNPAIKLINDGSLTPETRLGALGDLLLVIEKLKWQQEKIIVAPSDTFFAFALADFIDTIKQYPHDFATIVRVMDPILIQNRLGCALLASDHTITGFVEKPPQPLSPYAAIPFYYYPPEVIRLMPNYKAEGNSMDAPGNFIPWLLGQQLTVRACVVNAETIDVGTPKEVERLKALL